MSSSAGRLAERFTVAADRFPQFDAVIVSRPDLRAVAAEPLAKALAARIGNRTETEHLKDMAVDLPPGTMHLKDWRERGLLKSMSGVGFPRVIENGVVAYGRPKWLVTVYWPRADPSASRLFTTLCAEAGELLGDTEHGEEPDQCWLIHLAGRQRVRWVQDEIPPEDFPFQNVGWRETDGTDTDWWAVVLENVLNLSARELRQLAPGTRRSKPIDPNRDNLDYLQRRIVGLHRPNTSNASTAELARSDAEIQRLAKELGKTIDANFVQSCRTALRQKAKPKRKRS